jgi:hypothetical protein
MGLKLRYQLFYGAQPSDLYDIYAQVYTAAGHPLYIVTDPQPEDDWYEARLHQQDGGWTVLDSHGGWEWELRRQAQLAASRELGVSGLFVCVYDGDYWFYELFAHGVVLDHFVQDPLFEQEHDWFPGEDCSGQPALLAQQFPWITVQDAAAYLVRPPTYVDEEGELATDWAAEDRLDVPARPGDEFRRFDECAVLDFLRLLGVRVELRDHYVRLLAPVWRTFRISDDFWLHDR